MGGREDVSRISMHHLSEEKTVVTYYWTAKCFDDLTKRKKSMCLCLCVRGWVGGCLCVRVCACACVPVYMRVKG